MSASEKTIKAAFTHVDGEPPAKREYGVRLRTIPNGKVSVRVKRTAGTAAGKLTVYKTDSQEASNSKLDSKSWGDESTRVVDETPVSFTFLVLEAEFTDSNFGQVEVSITTN